MHLVAIESPRLDDEETTHPHSSRPYLVDSPADFLHSLAPRPPPSALPSSLYPASSLLLLVLLLLVILPVRRTPEQHLPIVFTSQMKEIQALASFKP